MSKLYDCTSIDLYDTPHSVENRLGVNKLHYRIGTFTSFRNMMLRRITTQRVKIDDALPDGVAGNEIVPLRTWSARDSSDYGIALLELWAYVGDILTFYQERIANEAYLRTATQRDNLMRLAALLDYKPNPGVAASTYLVFAVKEDATVELRAGLPVQHIPVQDEKPQKFETSSALVASARCNQLTPIPDQPQRLQLVRRQTSIVLDRLRVRVAAGDWLLMVGPPRAPDDPLTTDTQSYDAGSERWEVRQVNSVMRQEDVEETTITWIGGLGYLWDDNLVVVPEGNLFVFRGRAALFGYNAINWNLLANSVQNKLQPNSNGGGTTTNNGDPQNNSTDWINHEINSERRIDLDREYLQIEPGSWVVLMNSGYRELYRVLRVETVNRSDYLISQQVTRLYLDTDENFNRFGLAAGDPFSEIRGTVVLHTTDPLPIASRITPTAVQGSKLRFVDDVSTMEAGRQIMVYGLTEGQGSLRGEVRAVRQVIDNHTLALETPLNHDYVRAQTTIFANVVEATHGESVRNEIMGSGNAAIPFQTFGLKQSPLTFVPQAGAEGGAASTLELRVNGIRWREVPTFYGHSGNEAIFTSDIIEDQNTLVRLGDGKTGALPSSGRNNITATYRKGIGRAGNLPADVIQTLLERPKGLKSGHNPLPASGGVDPEPPERIRQNVPNTVRTFGRIVSLRDFEDAARDFTGVTKARAFLEWDGEWQTVKLVVAGEAGAEIVGPQFQTLVDDLNSRRDPNRKLSVFNYCPVDLALSALIYPDPDFLPEMVIASVKAVLEQEYSFDQLALGQSIPLSEVYHAIHQADGVIGAEITRFRAKPPAPCAAAPQARVARSSEQLQQVVRVQSYELARLDTMSPADFSLTSETTTT